MNQFFSLIPTIQSGKAIAVLEEKYAYPDRVGLCPGLNCNFFCSFCGRNYSASYEKELGDKGFEMYKQIIDQKISQLKSVQPIIENIWVVLSKDVNTNCKSFVLSKENNSFSKIIFKISQFSNVGKSNKFKILRI